MRPEQLFDGDVFLFCASRFVPDTAVKTGDVRMAQYALNRELAALYARKAREVHYKGLFCVVSDPVDRSAAPSGARATARRTAAGTGSVCFPIRCVGSVSA